jgi:hypothetical protein
LTTDDSDKTRPRFPIIRSRGTRIKTHQTRSKGGGTYHDIEQEPPGTTTFLPFPAETRNRNTFICCIKSGSSSNDRRPATEWDTGLALRRHRIRTSGSLELLKYIRDTSLPTRPRCCHLWARFAPPSHQKKRQRAKYKEVSLPAQIHIPPFERPFRTSFRLAAVLSNEDHRYRN